MEAIASVDNTYVYVYAGMEKGCRKISRARHMVYIPRAVSVKQARDVCDPFVLYMMGAICTVPNGINYTEKCVILCTIPRFFVSRRTPDGFGPAFWRNMRSDPAF